MSNLIQHSLIMECKPLCISKTYYFNDNYNYYDYFKPFSDMFSSYLLLSVLLKDMILRFK